MTYRKSDHSSLTLDPSQQLPLMQETPSRPTPSETSLPIALEHARRLTALYGTGSIQVALAWETVEELFTARHRARVATVTPFKQYCQRHPEAPECRVYDL